LLYIITFFREIDYHLSNACHCDFSGEF